VSEYRALGSVLEEILDDQRCATEPQLNVVGVQTPSPAHFASRVAEAREELWNSPRRISLKTSQLAWP
jgi:hypothetical protein